MIEIGGEKYPFKFGTNAAAILLDEKQMDLEEVFRRITNASENRFSALVDIRTIFYAGIRAGQLSLGQDDLITEFQAGDLVDDLLKEQDGLDRFMTVLTNSFPDTKKKAKEKKTIPKRIKEQKQLEK